MPAPFCSSATTATFSTASSSGVIVPEGGGRWSEYAGGYSDMLAQRGADVRREPNAAAKPARPKDAAKEKAASRNDDAPAARENTPKRKLRFHEKHALETLPKTMADLQANIAGLQRQLADPSLYARDRKAFDAASAALAAAQLDLAAAEEKWLAMEILREEIEGG